MKSNTKKKVRKTADRQENQHFGENIINDREC